MFPLTRLRPEQMAGSLIQAASLTTIDGQAHVVWQHRQVRPDERVRRALRRPGRGRIHRPRRHDPAAAPDDERRAGQGAHAGQPGRSAPPRRSRCSPASRKSRSKPPTWRSSRAGRPTTELAHFVARLADTDGGDGDRRRASTRWKTCTGRCQQHGVFVEPLTGE